MQKKTSVTHSAFFVARTVIAIALCFGGVALAFVAIKAPLSKPPAVVTNVEKESDEIPHLMPVPDDDDDESANLNRLEQYWTDRLTYPTGIFNPEWVRQAAQQHELLSLAVPAGSHARLFAAKLEDKRTGRKGNPLALSTTSWTGLGPMPERMTGCTGCYDYGTTAGRINDIVIDPTTTSNGSIVAYAAGVGGGVWKTTNCCSGTTTWASTTDDPLIATTAIDTLVIDPNDHNTVYAGTGDLNYGSFSMGSQGILKSTDAGAHWTTLGATVFGPAYTEPAGQFPQYDAVGKVRVDPNNSNNVVAGTKKGLFFSYDAGVNWTGPCTTNSFTTQRQDITGLELTNIAGATRIIAAIGTRGFPTPVQYDLGNQGANGIYSATMPASGCANFTSIASNANGFVFGTAVSGSPYTTAANLNAGSGVPYSNSTTGNQLSRIDIAVAPSDPNTIYAQAGSIASNTSSGCGNTSGCQLGAWVTTNGGTTWTFMTGSAGGSLTACTGSAGGGDYPQNWYDQGVVVDPNNADRVFFNTFDTWLVNRTGTSWYDTTCGYNGTPVANHIVHVDHHAQVYVPGSSDILLIGDDGGIHGTTNASAAITGSVRPTWFNMDGGFNTIEFYGGDIGANFATSSTPHAVGGAQDNGPSSVMFSGSPTGPAQWQMGLGGDGFSGQVNSLGTGLTQAQGTITLTTGGATAGQTFQIGSQTFTFVASGGGTNGNVTLNSSTTTEGNNIVTAINNTMSATVIAARSGATVIVAATTAGSAGNSIAFVNNNSANFAMNGSGTLGGTLQGGLPGTTEPVYWEGNNSGGLSRCISNCTVGGATWTSKMGGWSGDQQSFVLPVNLFHGGISGGDDCPSGGCGHMLAGTTRVWETITGNTTGSVGPVFWYITNNPAGPAAGPNLTKGTLGNRSYINQVKYSPKYQSVAIVGTNDGNVQIGFNLGTGTASQANWVNVTGSNAVLPNRPVLGISLDPSIAAVDLPVGYAAVGGFNANTPTTPGHVFQVTCASNCGSFNWLDKTGNLPDIPVDSVISNPNYPQQVFAGTDWGIYFTNDITAASPVWNRFNSGMPHTMVWDLQIDRGSTTLSAWTRGRGAWVYPLPSADIAEAPVLISAASRLTHTDVGPFDVTLPLSGNTGIEPRSDGSGNYTIVLTFDKPVNAGSSSVNSGTASVSNVSFMGNDMIVSLSGVANQQIVTLSANGVAGTNTQSTSASVRVGFLLGDANGSARVDGGDVLVTRQHNLETTTISNFTADVDLSGRIDGGDVLVTRNQNLTGLPSANGSADRGLNKAK